jgi:hypothetical protein
MELAGLSPLVQQIESMNYASSTALPRSPDTFSSGAMGPLAPIVPVGLDVPADGAERPMPRRWEYQVGWNRPIGQPGTEGLKVATFSTLRSIADLYSVVRTCITDCANDILATEWDIVPTMQAEKAMHGNQKAQDDFARRREEALKFWSRPDPDPKYPDWEQWMRALLEDYFVVDAATLYVHPSRGRGHGPFGSSMASLDYIDGTTIRPLVDIRGSTPPPGEVAYQQYLWGVPRVDLSAPVLSDDDGITAVMVDEFAGDQLLYRPNYTRSWTPYGFSNVERALIPAATGLRRQLLALQFYTEGTIPGLFVTPGPDISTPSQIAQLQRALNNIAGDQAFKHKIIVLPPGTKVDPQKVVNLADQFDAVLAAEITMAFEMTPLDIGVAPRVAAVQSPSASREFASTNTQNSQKRGLVPRLNFLKRTIFDFVMQRIWRQEDMQWRWTGIETGEDLTEKITVWSQLVRTGIASIDQAAQEFGIEAWGLPQTAEPLIYTQTGAVPVSTVGTAPLALPPGTPGQPALAPADDEQGQNSPGGAPPQTAPVAGGQPAHAPAAAGRKPTPSHHAAAAANADAPETHHAGKTVAAELDMLGRLLRKGRTPDSFVSSVLSPAALAAATAAMPDGVQAAVDAAGFVAKAEATAARRAEQLAAAHRTVAAGLGRIVRQYVNGTLSIVAALDTATAVMGRGYRDALEAGGAQASADHPDTPPIDHSAEATRRAEAQRPFLSGLISAVLAGADTDDIAGRLALYGATLNGAWNAGYGETMQAAHPTYEIEWQLGMADHCSLCVARDGKVFTFESLPGWPGDGGFGGADAICLGGPNCHCNLIYRENGRDLSAGGNTQRPASVPYYQSQLETITAARDAAAAARQQFLDTIPTDAAARAHTRDSLRQELADQENARIRGAGGYPGISTEGPDIPAGQVAALLPDWARATNPDLTKAPGQVAAAVRAQLAEDFPPDALGWVTDGTVTWTGPQLVPLSEVDFSDAGDWAAAHQPDRVAKFAKRLRKGKTVKPAVLIRVPDGRLVVADGHHRALAAQQTGRPVLAYVGRTTKQTGPWDSLHSSQYPKTTQKGGAVALQKAGYSLNPRSGMISLDLAPGTIPIVPGGVDDHHITVVYLGPDVDDTSWAQACAAAQQVAARTAPLSGTIGGRGEFPAGEDGVPVFAKVQLPGAADLHQALKHLQHPTAASATHGYTPHVTLTYAQDDHRPDPVPNTPVTFAELSLHRGDQIVRYPLAGGSSGSDA